YRAAVVASPGCRALVSGNPGSSASWACVAGAIVAPPETERRRSRCSGAPDTETGRGSGTSAVAPQHFLADDQLLDFARAGADLVVLGIAVESGGGRTLHQPRAAEDLHRLAGIVHGHFR